MNHTSAVKAVIRKRRTTRKSQIVFAAAFCFCLFGMSHSTFALQPITKQNDLTNQTLFKPNVSPEAGQASENPTRKFGSPYPFTVDQLKDMLLKVAVLKNAPKDGAKVLNIFNITVTELHHQEADKFLPASKRYILEANKDWYFNLSFFIHSKSEISSFAFGWPSHNKDRVEIYPEPPNGFCIGSEKFLKELERLGWQIENKTVIQKIPITYDLQKNNSHSLTLLFSHEEKCLLSFYVLWNAKLRS